MTVEERKNRVKKISGDIEFYCILQYVTAIKVRDVLYTSVIFFLARVQIVVASTERGEIGSLKIIY